MRVANFPKISVITPSYKAERLIEFTLKSVLDQQYPNLEYIVLDAGGDDTHKILERYDQQLKYWRSAPDGGQYQAISEGLNMATGEILCWLNSDDLMLPNSLFIVAEIFSTFPELDWISSLKPGACDANGYLYNFGKTPGFSKSAFLDGLYLPKALPRGHWIQQESTFFSAKLWNKIGRKIPDYDLAGDFALWCEFYKVTNLVGVDYPLSVFRKIHGQRSGEINSYLSEARAALEDLRRYESWSPLARNFVRYYIPKLKGKFANRFGFHGRKVINSNIKQTGLNWTIKNYGFMP